MKTPAQLAYEAYCRERYENANVVTPWNLLDAEERRGWEAAVTALEDL